MREHSDPIGERVLATPGLRPLVAEAEAVWRARADSGPHATNGPPAASGPPATDGSAPADGTGAHVDGRPGWRSFEDAFPTFYQFTNRPPR